MVNGTFYPLNSQKACREQPLLCWASEKRAAAATEVWVNPLALVEFTLETCWFWTTVIGPHLSEVASVMWRCGIKDAERPVPLKLPRGPLTDLRSPFAEPPHATKDFVSDWKSASSDDPAQHAYAILVDVYRRFAWGRDAIPYVNANAVDATKIPGVRS